MELDEANRELASLANTHHPELFLDTDRSLPSAIRRTELVVQRKFSDYANASLIGGSRNHIFQVEYGGRSLVLKQVPLEDKKSFEREVMVSHDLLHPNIVPVSAVFYDGLYGYIEMPRYPTTFGKWLDEPPGRGVEDVKPVMRYLPCTVWGWG
jgi:serine/threonine protein kinase